MSFNAYHVYSSNQGGVWSAPFMVGIPINSNFENHNYINVVSVREKVAIACVYRNTGSSAPTYRTYILESDNRTSYVQTIAHESQLNTSNLSMVFDKNNNLHLFRVSSGSNGYAGLYLDTRLNGQSNFTTRTIITPTVDDSVSYLSATTDSTGALFVSFYGRFSGIIGRYSIDNMSGFWGIPRNIGNNLGVSVVTLYNASTTDKYTYAPTVISGSGTKNYFTGGIIVSQPVPVLVGKLVYKIPQTDFVGGYFRKFGNLITKVFLDIDGLPSIELEITPTSNPNEFKFTHQFDTPTDFYLRFDLSRPSITGDDNDYMNRLLGGVSE